ncbi:hypothetical protein GE061_014003, partial [Apolygus lucorum]
MHRGEGAFLVSFPEHLFLISGNRSPVISLWILKDLSLDSLKSRTKWQKEIARPPATLTPPASHIMDIIDANPVAKIANFDGDLNPHMESSSHLVSDSSEYTEHFLAQLTADPLVLSSSQVSSVLSELEPSQVTAVHQDSLTIAKVVGADGSTADPPPPASPQPPVLPPPPTNKRYHVIKCVKVTLGELSWYRCSLCPYLATSQDLISSHYVNLHVDSVAAELRCLTCEVSFSRLQNLKHHYVIDHLVSLGDLPKLTKLTVEANKTWRDKNKHGKEDCSMVDSIESEIVTAEELFLDDEQMCESSRKTVTNRSMPSPPSPSADAPDPESPSTPSILSFVINKFPENGADIDVCITNDYAEEKQREEDAKKAEIKAEKEEKAIWKCTVEGCSLKFVTEGNMDYHKMCHEDGEGISVNERRVSPEWPLVQSDYDELSLDHTTEVVAAAADEEGDSMDLDYNITSSSSSSEDNERGEIVEPSNSDNSRKLHSCYFCYKTLTRMDKHLLSVHKQAPEVIKITQIPKMSQQRKNEMSLLIRKGDYHYNMNAIAGKTENLIVIHDPSAVTSPESKSVGYTPCPSCLGFVLKKQLWRHGKHCPSPSTENLGRSELHKLSAAMLFQLRADEENVDFLTDVTGPMRENDIKQVIMGDSTILKCALQMYESKGLNQKEIRQFMRETGRLLAVLKQEVDEDLQIIDVMSPLMFDKVVAAVKTLCLAQVDEGRPQLGKPGLALHLGHSLKKCARMVRGIAVRQGDEGMKKNSQDFLDLVDDEWEARVSARALSTLKHRKNATELLLLTGDLITFNHFLKTNMKTLQARIKVNFGMELWVALAETTLARLVMFNKRRSGEAARSLTSDYEKRKSWAEANIASDITSSLTPTEKGVAVSKQLMEIVGKRGSIVPVILTAEIAEAMSMLHSLRLTHKIQLSNPFFFATIKGGGNTYLRGHDVIGKYAAQAGLQKPELIRSTNLRKYAATVCQLLDLSPNEQRLLVKHLGHSQMVHEEFYRVHHSALELSKVGALLVAVDEGVVGRFAGSSLKNIDLKELVDDDSLRPPLSSDMEESWVGGRSQICTPPHDQQPSTSSGTSKN